MEEPEEVLQRFLQLFLWEANNKLSLYEDLRRITPSPVVPLDEGLRSGTISSLCSFSCEIMCASSASEDNVLGKVKVPTLSAGLSLISSIVLASIREKRWVTGAGRELDNTSFRISITPEIRSHKSSAILNERIPLPSLFIQTEANT